MPETPCRQDNQTGKIFLFRTPPERFFRIEFCLLFFLESFFSRIFRWKNIDFRGPIPDTFRRLSDLPSRIEWRPLSAAHPVPLLLFLLLLTGACRSTAPPGPIEIRTPDGFPNHSVEEVLDHLPKRPSDFATLYAETSVSVSSPEESGNFSTRISYREADSMLIRVRVKLGIEVARVLVVGDSTFIYDRVRNEEVVGETESIARLLPGAVLGTDLVGAALNYIQPSRDIAWILESDALRYRLISPDGTLLYVVDPGIWRVVIIETRDAEGMILEQRWYTDFRQFNQHVLPRRLQLSKPPEDTRLSMVLRRMDTEPESLSFDLGLKEDTRRIHVQ